ncbi:uncharacterized protein BXZ73DRAFT_41717, partial [Epithele typhae]|uniref:uncharacterized protein n=1 Tax=Epithele typhae TaxID=378194 RepID=UPI0020089B98
FLTHTLFSSTTLRFSDAQKRAVLSWGKAMHAVDVPSMYALKKADTAIRELDHNITRKVVSLAGNIFYMNEVRAAIAKDFSNPLTRYAMTDYPRANANSVSQVHDGSKMLQDLPDELSSPAVRVRGHIFFVNELLQTIHGTLYIPERFFYAPVEPSERSQSVKVDHELHALVREGKYQVDSRRVIAPISWFDLSYAELVEQGKMLAGFEGIFTCFKRCVLRLMMPNPLRAKAKGRMVYAVPLIVFMDDVSGNISKQWNKHHVIYMSNASLSREMLEKQFCVRFVTASPHASPMELMAAMKESICQAAEAGVEAWDCKYDEEVLLQPYGLFFAGDNPMQAEECCHAGLNCNYFCRTCFIGGTTAQKMTAEGFAKIFQVSTLCEPRTPAKTLEEVRRQISGTFLSGNKLKDGVTATGVKDSTTTAILSSVVELGKKLRKRPAGTLALPENENALHGTEIESHINPLIGMPVVGVDIHLDTPTEILHTVLLGVVKYFWGQTMHILDKSNHLDLFQTRLASVNVEGLNVPSLNAEYMVRYKGSLIGKHFKSIAQVMTFLIYDLVPMSVLDAWYVIGKLVVLLWHTTIEDLETYLANLSRTIEDFLNLTAQCSPSILLLKPKFHFLVHLPAYIRRFGPAIVFSTERYESFNHIFRLASVYSNRQAPSRDACRSFALNDIVKHIVTGGLWRDPVNHKWMRAGSAVLRYIADHPNHCRILGLPESCEDELIGMCEVYSVRTSRLVPDSAGLSVKIWSNTHTGRFLKGQDPAAYAQFSGQRFRVARAVVVTNRDVAAVGGDVLVKAAPACDDDQSKTSPARIEEILVPMNSGQNIASHVLVTFHEFLPTLHHRLRLPRLFMSTQKCVLPASDIICVINLQHDCSGSECNNFENSQVFQERLKSTRTRAVIKHNETNAYILNTHSIHNYDHIRSALPPALRLQLDTPCVSEADVADVRQKAVQNLIARKKKSKPLNEQQQTPAPEDDTILTVLPFERAPRKKRAALKTPKSVSSGSRTKAGAHKHSDQQPLSSMSVSLP